MRVRFDFLEPLKKRYGHSFVTKLEGIMSPATDVWAVGKAKDAFSEVLRKANAGECQVVKRPKGSEPVLVLSVGNLADLIEATEAEAPRRRFIDVIRPDPNLPMAGEPLRVEEDAPGSERFSL